MKRQVQIHAQQGDTDVRFQEEYPRRSDRRFREAELLEVLRTRWRPARLRQPRHGAGRVDDAAGVSLAGIRRLCAHAAAYDHSRLCRWRVERDQWTPPVSQSIACSADGCQAVAAASKL